MDKLYFPVIFHPEETGYSITVPDLEGCFSQGETLNEAVEMASEAIGLYLEGLSLLPVPSDPTTVCADLATGDFVMAVPFDQLAYQRRHSSKAVKKTLTIPSWLNEAAEEAHLNFSSVLQSALKERLNIND